MRLLASTDFAVRVLMLLAREPSGRPTSVDKLAQKLGGLSQNHLHKIVQDLTALGITCTVRGAGGGVLLAMAPEQVRLGILIRNLERDQAVVECFRPDGCACTLIPTCRFRGMLSNAQNSFFESLDGYSLADCNPDRDRAAGPGSPSVGRTAAGATRTSRRRGGR